MTTTPDRSTEIASYLTAVERHLNDLPTHIRQDLMSELDAHLTEVAADLEPGASLRDLLGSPEAYARELRDTAEVDKERVGTRLRRTVATAVAPAAAKLKAAADRFAVSTGHTDSVELAERLRPGWWVLRGALAGLLAVYLLSAIQFGGPVVYPILESVPLTLFAAGAVLFFVWLSLRVGTRSRGWGRRRRQWVAVAGAGLVVYAVYGLGWPFAWMLGADDYVETASMDTDPYAYVRDVYAYDENGNLLKGVYLFDQDGNPLWIGDPYSCGIATDDPFATQDPFAAQDPFATESTVDMGQVYEEEIASADENLGYQYPLCVPSETEATVPSEGATTPESTMSPGEDETPTAAETPSEPEPTASAETATPSETPTN
ncbi:HAAS signaling domain-containing protein [Glycomyces sp. NPDC048151]|uniref:HAAS signaling domain-containing protein n=1 Tax=Glycomyces sp. NPDC048151 TaxID=3364002 RepID=UPI003712C189